MAFITAVNEGATSVVQIDVSPGDPLTEIRGFAVDSNGNPVANAVVSVQGLAGQTSTAGDGSFSLGSVPTEFGFSTVVAESETLASIGAGTDLRVVPGGLTDAGIIVLRTLCEAVDPCIDTDGDWLPDDPEIALLLDPNNSDSDGNGIEDGDEDLWTFEGQVGEIVNLRATRTEGGLNFDPHIRAYGPNGQFLGSHAEDSEAVLTLVLEVAGTYQVSLSSWRLGFSGAYTLHYENNSANE